MSKVHSYRLTEAHLDHLMSLNGDQLIHIIARLTDRTVGIIRAFHEDGKIPQHLQELFGVEEYDTGHSNNSLDERAEETTHLLGGIIDLGAGVKEGHCSDECWCKESN